tara:strand:+ start:282 stop:401 length:120 start_codon:yes stop_codon:yes gene_type:complete
MELQVQFQIQDISQVVVEAGEVPLDQVDQVVVQQEELVL